MARTSTIFSVALCSPSGLEPDREAVRKAAVEVNRYLAADGKSVDVKGWESDVRPTVGSDAQSVVSSQIIENADIGIVLIADSIGTPTSRAESGTVEEARIFIRRRKAGEDVDLMLFFKRVPVRYDRASLERLSAVVSFREEMHAEGVFWKEYQSDAELAELVRIHLPNAVRGLQSNVAVNAVSVIETEDAWAESSPDETELGSLDHEIDFADAMVVLNEALQIVAQAAEKSTQDIGPLTENMTAAAQGPHRDPKAMKVAINGIGKALDEYADTIGSEVERFSVAAELAVNATIATIGLMGGDEVRGDPEDLINLATTIDETRESMAEMAKSTAEGAQAVGNLPRMTKELNLAKRRVVSESARLEAAVNNFSDRLGEVAIAARERAEQLNSN